MFFVYIVLDFAKVPLTDFNQTNCKYLRKNEQKHRQSCKYLIYISKTHKHKIKFLYFISTICSIEKFMLFFCFDNFLLFVLKKMNQLWFEIRVTMWAPMLIVLLSLCVCCETKSLGLFNGCMKTASVYCFCIAIPNKIVLCAFVIATVCLYGLNAKAKNKSNSINKPKKNNNNRINAWCHFTPFAMYGHTVLWIVSLF